MSSPPSEGQPSSAPDPATPGPGEDYFGAGLFRRLPGSRKSPPGLERTILRRLPRLLGWGTLLGITPSGLARFYEWEGSEAEVARAITTVDIWGLSFLALHWTVALMAGLLAFMVMVMKGPAYVADGYEVSDAERPRQPPSSGRVPPPNG